MKDSVIILLSILGVSVVLAFAHGETTVPQSNSALRDPKQIVAFRKTHPCPAGVDKGSIHKCYGYVVDHIKPLCFGGLDLPKNMAYQEYQESLKKDEFEREACALARKCSK